MLPFRKTSSVLNIPECHRISRSALLYMGSFCCGDLLLLSLLVLLLRFRVAEAAVASSPVAPEIPQVR